MNVKSMAAVTLFLTILVPVGHPTETSIVQQEIRKMEARYE